MHRKRYGIRSGWHEPAPDVVHQHRDVAGRRIVGNANGRVSDRRRQGVEQTRTPHGQRETIAVAERTREPIEVVPDVFDDVRPTVDHRALERRTGQRIGMLVHGSA